MSLCEYSLIGYLVYQVMYLKQTYLKAYRYCIEGIEMRQRSCKVRRLLFLKRYYPFQHTAAIFILERKEEEIGK
jgi:hypothetical protein